MVVINDCAIGVIMMRSILEGKNYVEYAISLWDRRLQETVKMLINWTVQNGLYRKDWTRTHMHSYKRIEAF